MAYRLSTASATKYTLGVSRFKGVDLAGNPTTKSTARADWAKNLIPDGNGYPETRHGYELAISAEGRINGIHSLKTLGGNKTLVHHGTKLSEWVNGTLNELYTGMADVKSVSAQLDGKLIILDGKVALAYYNHAEAPEEGWQATTLSSVAYAPLTMIASIPGATPGGTVHENVNLIGDYQKNRFIVAQAMNNGVLQLSDAPVSNVSVEKLNSSGIWEAVSDSGYTKDLTLGKLTFALLDATPVTGQDNYRVTFSSNHNLIKKIEEPFVVAQQEQVLEETCYIALRISDGKREFFTPAEWNGNSNKSLYVLMALDEDHPTSYETVKRYAFPIKYSDFSSGTDFTIRIDDADYFPETGAYAPPASDIIGADVVVDVSKTGVLVYQTSYDSHHLAYSSYGGDSWDMSLYTKVVENGGNLTLYVAAVNDLENEVSTTNETYYGYTNPFSIAALTMQYYRDSVVYADRVNLCSIIQKYGYAGNADRLFIGGNSAEPNMDFWSDIDNPLYFPEFNYAVVGDEATAIMGYSWLSDGSLAIHKAANGQDSTIYIRQGTTYDDQVAFTIKQGAVGLGVVSKYAGGYLEGEPLQLSNSGVFATVPVSNVAINERYAQNRSYFINPLLQKQDLAEAAGIVWQGKYYLAAGDYVFVADGGQKASSYKGDLVSYEWYIWDNLPVRVWYTAGDRLYFGTADGRICRMNDGYLDIDQPIEWEWVTPWLDFGRQTYYKKIKNVVVQTAARLWQNPQVEYRFPKKNGKVRQLMQGQEVASPYLKATNYKAKKVSLMQLRIFGTEACGLSALSILYTVSGKYKE